MSLTKFLKRYRRPAAMEESGASTGHSDAEAEKVLRRFTAPYRLHLACGTVHRPGWINIDRDPASEIIDLSWDLRDPLPIPDGSVEAIFHEHFMEHLTVEEGLAFSRQCKRLLMPGGVLRIAMPDLTECVRQYYENDWRQPWMEKYGYQHIQTRAENINIAFREWEHKWLYDREELHRRLKEAGFTKVRDCNVYESTVAHLCGLETRIESILVCEAIND